MSICSLHITRLVALLMVLSAGLALTHSSEQRPIQRDVSGYQVILGAGDLAQPLTALAPEGGNPPATLRWAENEAFRRFKVATWSPSQHHLYLPPTHVLAVANSTTLSYRKQPFMSVRYWHLPGQQHLNYVYRHYLV